MTQYKGAFLRFSPSVGEDVVLQKIMSEDFDYMVTPLVFDLELNFEISP